MNAYRLLCSAAALLISVSACANLTRLEVGECGNGVVEVGEDCDLFADQTLNPDVALACGAPDATATAQRCRYTCEFTPVQPGSVGRPGDPEIAANCPRGWACNQDDVCHHAVGSFQGGQDSTVAFSASQLDLGDLDGDAEADLIGFTDSTVQVRFGAGTGQFPSLLDLATPSQEGRSSFGLLGRMDAGGGGFMENVQGALIPLEVGLAVLRGLPDRTMIPVPTFLDIPPALAPPYRMVAVPAQTGFLQLPASGHVVLFEQATTLEIWLAPPSVDEPTPQDALPLAGGLRRLRNLTVIAEADVDTDPSIIPPKNGGDFTLAFRGDDRVFVYGMTADTQAVPAVTRRTEVSLTGISAKVLGGAMFARVDGDSHVDLIISVIEDGSMAERVAVALGNGDGTFDPPDLGNLFDPMGYPVAAGDVNGDGLADFIGPDAVHVTNAGTLVRAGERTSPNPWSEAVVSDFNGDGHADIAAVAGGEGGIDFLLGDSSGFFTYARILTTGEPFSLQVGDFDGNQISDLVFAENRGNSGFVSAVFGEPLGPPLGVTRISRFENQQIQYCDVGRVPPPADLTDELAVGTCDARDPSCTQSNEDSDPIPNVSTAYSIFFGTAERQIIPPLVFIGNLDDIEPDEVNVALFGDFTPMSNEDGDSDRDIVALTAAENVDSNGDGAVDGWSGRLWLLPGPFDGRGPAPETFLGAASQTENSFENIDFNLECALWRTGDIDNDGRDEIVAVDNSADCFDSAGAPAPRILVVDIGPPGPQQLQHLIRDLPGGLVAPREIELADLDRDDNLDLVVTYAGAVDESDCVTASSGAIVYWSLSSSGELAEHLRLPDLPDSRIPAIGVLNSDADRELELAIWTSGNIHIADLKHAGCPDPADPNRPCESLELERPLSFAVVPGDQFAPPVCEGSLRAGDVNGDGLADLVLADEERAIVRLAVPHTEDVNIFDGPVRQ